MKFKSSNLMLLTVLLISGKSFAGITANEALIAGEETTVKTLQEKGQVLSTAQDKKHIRYSNTAPMFLSTGESGEDVFEYEEEPINPDDVDGLPQASYDTEPPAKKVAEKPVQKKKHHLKKKRKAPAFKSNCDI